MRKTGGVAIVKVKRVTGVDVSREWIIDKLETGKKNRTKKIQSSICVSERGLRWTRRVRSEWCCNLKDTCVNMHSLLPQRS